MEMDLENVVLVVVKDEPVSEPEPESEEETQDFGGGEGSDDSNDDDEVLQSFSEISKQEKEREHWKNQKRAKRRRATEEEIEERRRKDRERKRLWRSQLKQQREESKAESETLCPSGEREGTSKGAKENEGDNEEEDDDEEGGSKEKRSSRIARESTVKTHEDLRERWKADQRRRRQRLREQMSEADREEQKRKDRERARARRAKLLGKVPQKEGEGGGDGDSTSSSQPPISSAEAVRAKWRIEARERRKRRRETMTEEQLQEERQRRSLQRLEKKINMTDEERELEKTRRYLSYLDKQAKLPEEELERRKKKRAEAAKRLRIERLKRCPVTDEERAKKRADYRKWRNNMTPEQLARYREKGRLNTLKVLERMRQDPERWKEKRRRMTEMDTLRRRAKRLAEGKPLRKKRRKGSPVPEGEEEKQPKKGRTRKKFTDGISKRARNVQCCRDKLARETPDQRMKRLMAQRFRSAKRALRKKLTEQGKSFEEIEREMEDLEKTWRPSNRFLKPHARPRLRDPQIEKELELFALAKSKMASEEEEKPDLENIDTSFTPLQAETERLQPLLQIKTDPAPPAVEFEVVCHPVNSPHQEIQLHQPQSQPVPPQPPQLDSQQHYYHPNIQDYSLPFYGQPSSSTATPQQLDTSMSNNIVTEEVNEDYTSSTGFDDADSSSPLAPSSPMSPSNFEDLADPPLLPPPPPLFSSPSKQEKESDQLLTSNSNSQPQPKKVKTPRKQYPSTGLPRVGPRGGRLKTQEKYKQLAVCDICGHSYPPRYMLEHTRKLHNPNYDGVTKCCKLCNAGPFHTCWKFYQSHWMVDHHLEQKAIQEGFKPFICEECGAAYKTKVGCDFHKYNIHGEGSRGSVKCPYCSKEMKNKISLNGHMHRFHKGEGRKPCLRCDGKFRDNEELKQHVQKEHPDSYFPCQRCGVMKYTLATKLFHYENCKKKRRFGMTEEMRRERKESKKKAVNMTLMECEVCEARMRLDSLWRHYWNVHGVREDKFKCLKEGCEKMFKQREYWVGHMEVAHEMEVETVKEEVRKYNVVDRSKVKILNSKGARCKFSRTAENNKRRSLTKRKRIDAAKKGGGRRKTSSRKSHDEEEDEEEEEELSGDDDNTENDSDSDSDSEPYSQKLKRRRRKANKEEGEERVAGTRRSERRTRKPIKDQSRNDDDNTENDSASDSESERYSQRLRRRRRVVKKGEGEEGVIGTRRSERRTRKPITYHSNSDDDNTENDSDSEPYSQRVKRRRRIVKKKEEEEMVVGARKPITITYQNNNDFNHDNIEKDKRLVISIVPLKLTPTQYAFLLRNSSKENNVVSSSSTKEGEESEADAIPEKNQLGILRRDEQKGADDHDESAGASDFITAIE